MFDKFEVFVVFDSLSVQFTRDFVLRSNTINSKTKKRDMHSFFEEAFQRFASKTLQNDSKGVENFQHLQFWRACVLFELFSSQNVDKRLTKTELIFH